jgi:hypothetical protein
MVIFISIVCLNPKVARLLSLPTFHQRGRKATPFGAGHFWTDDEMYVYSSALVRFCMVLGTKF